VPALATTTQAQDTRLSRGSSSQPRTTASASRSRVGGDLIYILLIAVREDGPREEAGDHGTGTSSSLTQARTSARLTAEQKQLIERAAALRGTSVTEFVVVRAQAAARSAIKEFEVLRLRDEAREVFLNAALNPPTPNEAARSTAERYKKNTASY
jgi:uncharacterized protein (DUF1778 family)